MGRTLRRRRKLRLSPRPSRNLASESDYVELTKWMSRSDWCLTCPITPAHFPGTGRGFRAEQNIEAGRTIVSIPVDLLITTKTVAESEVGELFRHSSSSHAAQLVLSAFLLFERNRGSESPWFCYINTIPKQFDVPAFMSDIELSHLPAFLSKRVSSQREILSANYDSLMRLTGTFCYEDFLWAWFSVNSRSVYHVGRSSISLSVSDKDCLALVPYLDIFNHSDSARTVARLNADGKRYEILTLDSCGRHGQVFIDYGPHSNLKLFLEYGFVLPANSNDSVELSYEEVLESAALLFPESHDSVAKLSFVETNSIGRNLYVGPTGVSYNVTSLVHTLLASSREFSSRSFSQSLFSRDFSPRQRERIEAVSRAAVDAKRERLSADLKRMERIGEAGGSFIVAKGLVREYLKLLERF